MEIPEHVRFTKDHEWVRIENECATVGITEFAQSELGELVFVDLPPVGKSLEQHATMCVVESTKAASDVYAPLSGTVKEVNTALQTTPALVNSEPYTAGWMVKIEKLDATQIDSLLSAAQYKDLLDGKA